MKLNAHFCDPCGPDELTLAVDRLHLRSASAKPLRLDLCEAHRASLYKSLQSLGIASTASRSKRKAASSKPKQHRRGPIIRRANANEVAAKRIAIVRYLRRLERPASFAELQRFAKLSAGQLNSHISALIASHNIRRVRQGYYDLLTTTSSKRKAAA